MSEDRELEEIKRRKMRELLYHLKRKEEGMKLPTGPIDADAETFYRYIQKEVLVLVDFWAVWCAPCLIMHPIVEEIAKEFNGKLIVLRVNVDLNRDLAMRYGVQSIPTFIIFKEGKEVKRIIGAVGEYLKEVVKAYL
ncbi:thioredoxin [Candidatus Bathyarchaeota archaeon ex4484_205]|nr:MAG: thioredoxin [Candidatus Bathyarchaeota archaeon ex4484_205]RLG67697.1 MAG: thioredoxin [archaeon]